MITGFIIWSLTALVPLGIGIYDYNAKKPVGFWTGINPPEVTDVKKYNHAVAWIWIIFAVIFELLGVPLLTLKQNSAGFVWTILGSVALCIALMVAYVQIERKYKK
jgi:hypothetical protein